MPRAIFLAAVTDVNDQGDQKSQTNPFSPPNLNPRADVIGSASPDLRSEAERDAITVLVVDDHPGFRGALESLIRTDRDLLLLGSASGGEEAVLLGAQLVPRVVVMDLAMPGVNGVEATRRLRGQQLPPAVVALSGSHELIRDAIAAGAAFTVLKDVDPDRLLGLIRDAGRPTAD